MALYQLWQFVAPGLLPKERKFVGPFVAFGTLFFVGGALFCYLLVLPTMFEFLLRPGEAGPLRDRIALVRPQADDAVRLLMLGDLERAQRLAGAVEESLAKAGDGQTAAPQAVSSSKTELAERLAQLGHLLDLEVAAPGDASRRAALGEAITRRAEAQLLFEQGALPAASAKLEDGVAAIGNAHPGAGAAVLTVWSAEKHLSAAKGRLTDQEWTRPMLSMKEQLSLVLLLEVAFGAIFELPLIMALLSIVGLLKFAFVARYQRHAILACVVLAAIITPSGDAVNLGLMALPMIFCFELGVLLVFLLEKRRPAAPATSPPAT